VSCHGVHGIRGAESNLSRVHPKRVPETCGGCHADAEYMRGYLADDGRPLPTDQVRRFEKSVHGRALLQEGDLGAPSCNDCHGNHAARPPEVASVSQVCRTCHVTQATLFDGSKHKKAFAANGWPECERCHGKHDIEVAEDDMLGSAASGLCVDCHREKARDNRDCEEVASHFRESIATLAKALEESGEVIERVARRGQDTDDLVAAKSDLEDALIRSRTAIHAFERSTFDQDGDRGKTALARSRELFAAAEEELAFRQRGVAIFIGIMVLLALGLYLRLRAIEARERAAVSEQGER
jgi:predicted CXXCH cytochrome family protein